MKILRTDPEKSEKEIQVYLILVEIKDMATKTNTQVKRWKLRKYICTKQNTENDQKTSKKGKFCIINVTKQHKKIFHMLEYAKKHNASNRECKI